MSGKINRGLQLAFLDGRYVEILGDNMTGALLITVGGKTLTLTGGSITDDSGAISFGDENLLTTGTLGAGAATVTSLDAGSGAITTTGTAFLGLIDLGTNTIDDLAMTGAWDMNSGALTNVNIDSGTLDGVQIGGTTATGELFVNDASDDADGLGSQGTSGQTLTSAGAGANPVWASLVSGNAYTEAFVDGDLAAGSITITHNLGIQYCAVHVYDNSDEMVIPDGIDATGVNALDLDLSSYGTITGTWNIVVVAGEPTGIGGVKSAIIWAEEGGNMNATSYGGLQYSFGNGDVAGQGPRQAGAGTVVAMSIQCNTSADATGEVHIAVNGVSAGGEYHLDTPGAANGGSVLTFATPLAFSASDRLSFITTVTPTGVTNGTVMTMWVLYD